jgi:hypothetical protein
LHWIRSAQLLFDRIREDGSEQSGSENCLLALKPRTSVSQMIEFGGIAAMAFRPIFVLILMRS